MRTRRSPLLGPRLTLVLASVLTALFLARLFLPGLGEDSLRGVIRLSAQTSVVLFCAVFSASSLHFLSAGPISTWLLRERRYLGLSFAYSHLCHLAALVGLAALSPPFVEGLGPVTLVLGGAAYGFILLMAATSNGASVKRLGARRWSSLHTIGAWYLWISFFQAYAPRAFKVSPVYALPTLLLLATLAVRLTAGWSRRQRVQHPG